MSEYLQNCGADQNNANKSCLMIERFTKDGTANDGVVIAIALKDLRKGPISLDQEVSMLEQIYMDQALKLCGNNVTKAAALLGITRFSMKRRLDKED